MGERTAVAEGGVLVVAEGGAIGVIRCCIQHMCSWVIVVH